MTNTYRVELVHPELVQRITVNLFDVGGGWNVVDVIILNKKNSLMKGKDKKIVLIHF